MKIITRVTLIVVSILYPASVYAAVEHEVDKQQCRFNRSGNSSKSAGDLKGPCRACLEEKNAQAAAENAKLQASARAAREAEEKASRDKIANDKRISEQKLQQDNNAKTAADKREADEKLAMERIAKDRMANELNRADGKIVSGGGGEAVSYEKYAWVCGRFTANGGTGTKVALIIIEPFPVKAEMRDKFYKLGWIFEKEYGIGRVRAGYKMDQYKDDLEIFDDRDDAKKQAIKWGVRTDYAYIYSVSWHPSSEFTGVSGGPKPSEVKILQIRNHE